VRPDARRRFGATALVALLALVAVAWMSAAPHGHSGDGTERHCPSCQAARGAAPAAPALASTGLPRPAAAVRLADLPAGRVESDRHGERSSGRAPPSPLS